MEDEQCANSRKLNWTSLTKVSCQSDQKREGNGSRVDSIQNQFSAFSVTQSETELTLNKVSSSRWPSILLRCIEHLVIVVCISVII